MGSLVVFVVVVVLGLELGVSLGGHVPKSTVEDSGTSNVLTKKDYESNKLRCTKPLSLKVLNLIYLKESSPEQNVLPN